MLTLLGMHADQGLVIQFPIGALSDRIDRRRLMLALTMAAASAAALIAGVDGHSFPLLLTLSLIMGGLIQPLYALSIAQTYDYLEPREFVAASGGLLLAYSVNRR